MPKWKADAKKKEKEKEAQRLAQSVVNTTVKVAKDTSKAVSSKGQSSASNNRSSSRMTDAQYQKTYGRPRSSTSQRTSTVKRPPTTRTNTARLTDAQRQKMGLNDQMSTAERIKARTEKISGGSQRTDRQTLAQAMKSGDYKKAEELRGKPKAGSLREKYETWDKDIADTVTHTVKQGLAADARVANQGMKGITDKDAFLYTTEEQRKKADEKFQRRESKLAKKVEEEGQAIEDIQKKHGYIGRQALSAVSSTTGMGMDIAANALLPGSGLAHMWARSTGTSMGQVNKKAASLRNQLEATGQYSKDELDEMFKNTDALDMANAAASGGVEVLSELLFPGIGAARKVIGGKGMSIAERVGAKLFNKVGAKASTGLLKNLTKGTVEEIAEEEIGGPVQAWAANLIYGNRFQAYNEDAIKRTLMDESNALRGNITSEDDARAASARLNSKEFMEESVKMYMDSGHTKEEAEDLAELSRDYLTASLAGDVDAMKDAQDKMVKLMAGGENSMKEKFTLQDAIDAAVSTAMMTTVTGAPAAMSTLQIGNSYKESVGLDAVKQQAEMIRNWSDSKEASKAQAIIDNIDNGGDVSGTQVYDIIQQAGEVAAENKESEETKNRVAQVEMNKRDLRISPINEDGSFAPQTEQRYEQIVSSTVSRYETLTKIGESEGFEREDVELGADIGAAFETGVISSEQINELARGSAAVKTIFEDVTGIDISQFDSYPEMRDALMAQAADNMVNSARLEQAAWNDEARGEVGASFSAGIGANGDIAIQHALNTVDPRDQGKFMLTGQAARRVYEYARYTTDSWDQVKREMGDMFKGVSDVALKYAYNAAKEDKAKAETKYYGKQVNKNSLNTEDVAVAEGKFTNESARALTGSEISTLAAVASELGINVIMTDKLARNENGRYIAKDRTIMLNSSNTMDENLEAIFSHEVTHHLAAYAPDEYLKLSRFVMDRYYKNNPEAFKKDIQGIQDLYIKAKEQELSPEQALEELIADGSRDFWSDEEFITAITTEEPSLAKSIINAIKDFLQKLRNILSSGSITDEATREGFFSEINAYDEAYRLWLNAYNAARSDQAQQAIDDWQDQVNERSTERYSISDSDYMDAVNSGDMETAQRMVDEAAKAAGYVESVYHGTGEYFNVFRRSGEGIHLGNIDQATQVANIRSEKSEKTWYAWDDLRDNLDKLDYASKHEIVERLENADHSSEYGDYGDLSDIQRIREYGERVSSEYMQRNGIQPSVHLRTFDRQVGEHVMHLYAKISHPYVIDDDLVDWSPIMIAKAILNRAEGRKGLRDSYTGKTFNITGEPITLDKATKKTLRAIYNRDIKGTDQAWDALTDALQSAGYDGIKYLNKYEGDKNSYSYIALRPSDVKSADPVTYDDNGNVIPLSERFKPENADIRFSISKPSNWERGIFGLTGEPISQEYKDAVEYLENGGTLGEGGFDAAWYNGLPEVQEARRRIGDEAETITDKSPERIKLREGWVQDLMNYGSARDAIVDGKRTTVYDGDVRQDRRIDLIVGLPSSGKSSALVDPISFKYKSRLLDSDEAKKLIPEFDDGWGAGRVHEESSQLLSDAFVLSLENGDNIVMPILGKSVNSIEKRIKLARQFDYEVYVRMCDLPANKAAARNLIRFINTGRFVDLEQTSLAALNGPAESFDAVVKKGEIDGYTEVSNDVERGQNPEFVRGEKDISYDWRDSGQRREGVLGEDRSTNEGETSGQSDEVRYSISSISEAAGLTFSKRDGRTILTDRNGNEITEVTPAYLKKTPIGRLLTLSESDAYNVMSDTAVDNRLKFLSDLYNMILDTQDIDLIWAVSGTLGYDPMHLVDENTPQNKIKEQKSKFASITGNSDPQYKSTIDFTTICVKTQAIIDAMSSLMKKLNRGLTEHEIIDIVYNETHLAGEQVPCPVCYVFSRWVGLGNLFSKIQEFQERYPEGADMSLIAKEYDALQAEVGEMASSLGIRGGKARDILYRQTLERKNQLDELVYYDRASDEEKQELETIDRRLEVLDHWSWLGKTRLDPNYKEVPADVLFDINAGREFATKYPAVWKFRTTRGPSLGKAAAPYTPSRLGDTIRGIASPGALKDIGTGARPFLAKSTTKTARNYFNKAVMNAKRQNRMNGQRLQSTSDFRFEYGLDYILSFLELEAIGAKAQMYTKVPEAVKFLASTRAEVNCSIMPLGRGVDENGNLVFSDVTGMSWADALALSKAYDNVQPILVAIGPDHLTAAMADKDITMIIPYHASGSSEGRYISMMQTVGESVEDRTDFAEYEGEHEIEDATPEQVLARNLRIDILTGKKEILKPAEKQVLENNEILRQLYIRIYGMDENGNEAKPDSKYVENYDENGNDADCYGVYLTKDQAKVMMPYEYWDKTSTIKDADKQGKAYQEYCKSLGITPVFSGWDSKGKYHEDMDFSDKPGYWKTLIDRCMYNNDGTYHKQNAINLDDVDLDMLDSEMMRDEVVKPLQVNDPAKTEEIVNNALKRIEAEQVRYSISAKYDKEYDKAIRHPIDWDKAQELTNAAARDAGFTLQVYHGTRAEEEFYKFEKPINNESRYEGGAGFVYVTTDESYADIYASAGDWDEPGGFVMEGFINPDNFLDIGVVDHIAFEDEITGLPEAPNYNDEAAINSRASKDLRGVAAALKMTPYELIQAIGERVYRDIGFHENTYDLVNRPEFAQLIRDRGYKGIKLMEYGSQAYGLLDITQFKSSEAITYDDDGSPIPLSQRFDPSNDDIRYSLPTQDSEGNILTDGQMEYFKNSKARDSEGRLVPVYHTTKHGGFTIFDPAYSDDNRSLFFTDNYYVSQTYAEDAFIKASEYYEDGQGASYYKCYLDLQNPLIIEGKGQNWYNIVDGGSTFPEGSKIDFRTKDRLLKDAAFRDEHFAKGNFETNGDDLRKRANALGEDEAEVTWFFKGDDGKWKELHAIVPRTNEEAISKAVNNLVGFDKDDSFGSDVAFGAISDLKSSDISSFTSGDLRGLIEDFGYNTREWADIAEDYGHDGLILRDIIDLGKHHFNGKYHGASKVSTVYVAFSSEQVKDINNKNPTEDPDIRYSITPEDEAMEWLASQYELDDVPLEDQVAEEGRVRMAKSKQDFISSRNALWNERWLTEGKVLDTKSVEKNIRELVKGAMMNSDTPSKYKQELVNKTLIDAKSAYWLMKEGKHSEAANLLWDSAVKMIENVDFIEDEAFKQYKGLRDYMRTTSFRLGEEYWSDVDFGSFRKRNFGRIKLVKGETNIDELYQELQERWPEWFDEEEQMTAPDQLLRIEEVLDTIQPYKIAYSSEEAQEIAGDIASDLYDIVYQGEEYKSIADTYKEKYDAKTKALKERHQEALRNVRERRDELLAEEKEKTSRQKERAELWKSRTFEEKAKRQKDRDVRKKAKHFGRIAANIDWLTTRLINETKDKNIPEGFRRSLAHMLMQFDMQTERSKKLEEKYGPAKKTLQMRELKDRLEKISKEDDTGEFRYDGYLFYLMDALAEKVDGQVIDALDTEDLIVIDTMLKSIRHNFSNYNKIRLEEEKVAIERVGDSTISIMKDRIQKYGKRRNRAGTLGLFDKLLNEGEQTPIYLFERLDPTGVGIGAMYKELRRGEDRHIQNMNFLRNRFKSMFQDYFNKSKPGSELESWRDESQSQTFNLEDGPITLTPAQMMSLYCLSKRPQAMGHILGSGIVASPVSFGAKLRNQVKGKNEQVNSVRIKYSEIQDIISKLTPDQIKLADEMQSLLNNEMAAWGNETSLEMHGIKLFREKDYFPIKSSGESLQKTADSFDTQEKIKNFGFTKPLVRNANNAIMIDDIFSVVADHCNKMSLYNAMAIPISDFMRVYNYKQRREDGTVETSVQAMIGEAFTRKTNDYIMKFIGDVNGNTKTRSDAVNDLMNKALANYKKASIGFNARVALQQPTAIVRSLMVIDSKYFAGIKPISAKEKQEMFEHCPIAMWKSWGHYDMDMGRDIEDIMMNNDWTWSDKVFMGAYGALDNWAWHLVWQAVKNEIKDKHPDVKVGSNQFYRLCNERASEVFDKTQVVDSIFHRSDTMRSKNTLTKMATSFMAEPTLTYNVFRDSLVKARDLIKDGETAEASKLLLKMMGVLALNAAAVSASAAIWDAVRGKGGDDDEDDEKLFERGLMWLVRKMGGSDPWAKEDKSAKDLWLINFLNNFVENAPWAQWNNVYFVKDIVSLKDGWGTSNMALEGWETLFKGLSQMHKKLTDGSDKSWYDISMNILGGFGYLTGYPAKTFLRDAKAIWDKINEKFQVFAADGSESTSESGGVIRNLSLPGIENGSSVDNFLNRFGINLTEDEKEAREIESKTADIAKKYEDLTGEEKDKKVWSSVTSYLKDQNSDKGVADFVAEGDYSTIRKYKQMYLDAGGNEEYFDSRIFDLSKKAMKKTIIYDPTDAQMNQQERIKDYLLNNGMTEEELSDMVYKSELAKDMKVAFRLNDKELMLQTLEPLVYAGITYDDLVRLWDNRNRMQLSSYKGRYKDKLKSTGTFIWPTDGVITSHFGYRNAPTAGASSNHPAIDIGAPSGTPVIAADGGTVIYAGNNGGYGNSVGIKHDNGMVTYYNHLSAWNVKVGDTVGQGQQIAAVGSTGISTGPHLDFKILDQNGNPVDPEKYLNKRS